MKYYAIIQNINLFIPYIINKSNNGNGIICFEDKNIDDIYKLSSIELEKTFDNIAEYNCNKSELFLDCVGEDNYLYKLSFANGSMSKEQKCKLEKLYTIYKKLNSYNNKFKLISDKIEVLKNSEIIKTFSAINSYNYKSYKYLSKEWNRIIPFRLKKSNNKDLKPLFVYLHGVACFGRRNLFPMLEFLGVNIKLSKNQCHVLIPQCDLSPNRSIADINGYISCIKDLILMLGKTNNIDMNRIYITGISFGGSCVWYSLYKYPDFYAAAIPLMGNMPFLNASCFDINRLQYENIWVGHSEDDKVSPIVDDNKLVEMLKLKDNNIKYTRYKKYGHKMAPKFYKNECWKEWMFSQIREKK